MEYNEFYKIMNEKCNKINIKMTDEQVKKFYKYMLLLIEWNKVMNLTAITDPDEIIQKHFIDSLTIFKYISKDDKILDIGTGAGFPGIPIAIISSNEILLVDSLNKRINFLNEVVKELNLENVKCKHFRAEEIGNNKEYREKYDVITSRAVASMNVLLEYMLPLCKLDGHCICMKGSNIDEINECDDALKILGGKIEDIITLNLPDSLEKRNIVLVKKKKNTPKRYPRKAGMPSKNPL